MWIHIHGKEKNMSRWISKDLFKEFQKEKIEEKDSKSGGNFIRSNLLWPTPEKGTMEQAKVYEGRFVPDKKGEFYKKYYYHMFQSGETWYFVICPKTDNFKDYCPFCSSVSKLYSGSKQDMVNAYNIKRKERFVSNFYVARDFRDEERDEEKKCVGKVKLYEFPSKLEQKLKKEVTDKDQGYGLEVFDPGENGRNFIIEVLSTKKDKNGKQWPDYSNSGFSRSQSALGTEEEIDALMETCVDIAEYIDSKRVDKDKQLEILKSEFLFGLIEDECAKNGYFGEIAEQEAVVDALEESFETNSTESVGSEENNEEAEEEPVQEETVNADDGFDSDDDLLSELDNM